MFAFASVPSNTTRILYLCNRSVTTIKKIVTTAVSVTNVTTASTIKPIQVNRLGDALLFAVHNNPCIGLPTATNIVDSALVIIFSRVQIHRLYDKDVLETYFMTRK